MSRQHYQAVIAWFNARPLARDALGLARKGAVALVYLLYLLLLGWLAWRCAPAFWRTLLVPAVVFLLGTALRAAIDRPRPYEALHFQPLFPKDTRGKSFPSRHCFSAAAIAAAAWRAAGPALGLPAVLLAVIIAVSRVLVGHHYVSDVLAGLAFGAAAALPA
ncbi:MAG: phosphatase PAP2 family protein, partial [Gemmiger sp.]